MRFDSGFWSGDTLAVLARHGVRYTMAVRTNTKGVAEAIAAIDEAAWVDIDYTPDGQAQVAETEYRARRLIVRRTRLTERRQAQLWPDWRHFGFLTDLDGTAVEVDDFHRAHASIELAIRDLKEGSGLEHCPSGSFSANSAWLQCTVLAHNLIRWTATIGETVEALTVARTVRTRILAVPARIVNRSGTLTLRAPARWPWADQSARRLATIRALPAPTG
jgi:Transposase DDE domain group 1